MRLEGASPYCHLALGQRPQDSAEAPQRAQYPLIKEYLGFLKGLLKGIYRGSIRGLRNSGLNYVGLHIMI